MSAVCLIAFVYVSHQVTNNFLMLLDDFFMYKEKAMAREQPSTWILKASTSPMHTHCICLCLVESS